MDAPVGPLATPKDLLRTSLANCTAFREWDGADYTVDEAKSRIYFDALPPASGAEYTVAELDDLRPYAIVSLDENGIEYEYEAAPNSYKMRGRLVVCLERKFPDVSGETNPNEAADRQFENMVGPLIRTGNPSSPGLLDLSGTAGYLFVRRVALHGPYRVEAKDVRQLGDYQRCFLFIEWGMA
jgi:hypothetical protein